ncbi:MAG: VOC family protein [Thermoplasmata archaeon]
MSFAHVSIRTSNMERSISFYQRYFGMRMVSRREIPENNAEIAFLESEGESFQLELTWYRSQKRFEQAEYENRTFDHLAFVVTGLDALVSKMKEEGVVVTDEPFTARATGKRYAFVEDPDGTLIELIERR